MCGSYIGVGSNSASVIIKQYLRTDDEAELEKVVRSSSLWAFVRLIGQIKKKPLSDKDEEAVRILTEKIRSLIN